MTTKRIRTPGAQAIREAREAVKAEYPHAKDWQVKRLALLQVSRDSIEAQVAAGMAIDLAALLKVDEVIETTRQTIAAVEPISVQVNIVDRTIKVCDVVCKHCGQSGRYQISDKPFNDGIGREIAPKSETATGEAAKPDSDGSAADPSNALAPAADEPKPPAPPPSITAAPVVTHLQGVSGSKFHSQLINGGERAPLKKLAPPTYFSAEHERGRHPYKNPDGTDRTVGHPLPLNGPHLKKQR